MTLSNDKNFLYTVSDKTSEIYKLNFQGDLLATIKLNEPLDLEGICSDKDSSLLWVVEEQNREILKINLDGDILFRKKIFYDTDNSGLEGICFGKNGNLVVIKEKEPAYFVELDENFEITTMIQLEYEPDYSAITWDSEIDEYMMLSQQGKKLLFYLPGEELVQVIELPMVNAEGIAYNPLTNMLFIVDDDGSKMYQYLLIKN